MALEERVVGLERALSEHEISCAQDKATVAGELAQLRSWAATMAKDLEEYHKRLGELEDGRHEMVSGLKSINDKLDGLLELDKRLRLIELANATSDGKKSMIALAVVGLASLAGSIGGALGLEWLKQVVLNPPPQRDQPRQEMRDLPMMPMRREPTQPEQASDIERPPAGGYPPQIKRKD